MEKVNLYLEMMICMGTILLAVLLVIYVIIGVYNIHLRNQFKIAVEYQEIADLFYVAGISFVLFYVSISVLKSLPKEQQGIKIEITQH